MAVVRRFDDWKCAMLVQALLLIAVIVVISGSILTNTLVTARAGFAQAVQAQSRTAMSDATADFVTWAQARVQTGTSQTSWRAKIVSGRSDSDEFRPICDPSLVAAGNTTPACAHWEHNTWMVTGGTTVGSQTQPLPAYVPVGNGGTVENLARTVDEQRITAIISTEVKSSDGRQTYASDSREITARTFDAAPWVLVTGIKEIGTIDGGIRTGEGDSGGYLAAASRLSHSQLQPDPVNPAAVTDTRIITEVNCFNNPSVSQTNPFLNNNNVEVLGPGRDGNQDWKYELACTPKYPTSNPPDPQYQKPTTTVYAAAGDQNSPAPLSKSIDASSFSN